MDTTPTAPPPPQAPSLCSRSFQLGRVCSPRRLGAAPRKPVCATHTPGLRRERRGRTVTAGTRLLLPAGWRPCPSPGLRCPRLVGSRVRVRAEDGMCGDPRNCSFFPPFSQRELKVRLILLFPRRRIERRASLSFCGEICPRDRETCGVSGAFPRIRGWEILLPESQRGSSRVSDGSSFSWRLENKLCKAAKTEDEINVSNIGFV